MEAPIKVKNKIGKKNQGLWYLTEAARYHGINTHTKENNFYPYATRGGIRKHSLPLLILTFPLLYFSLLHALLFTHFGAPRKLILGMPPYFDPTIEGIFVLKNQ